MMISRKNILLNMVSCLAIVLSACSLPSPTPGLPAPARSTQLYVSTSGNDSNDCLSEASPCLTVHSAVTKAEPYSVIHIGPGEFLEVQDNHTNSSLTLIGAGRDQTIIRHATYGVVFQVNSTEGYLTIQDLTIGSSGGEGWRDGIVVHIGAHVLIENCRVTENQIGVGIAENGSATINNSVIEGNASGIDNRGHLEMSNTTLQHNAEGTIAGDIAGPALRNEATANITGSTFDRNGLWYADGIRHTQVIYNSGEMNISNSRFSNNSGQTVYSDGGNLVLDHVLIVLNTTVGITQARGHLTVRSSIIKDNAYDGITVGGYGEYDYEGWVKIFETAIVGNHGYGLRADAGDVTVQNTTISGTLTFAGDGGTGIINDDGNLFLLDSTVAFNQGRGVVVTSRPGAVLTMRRSVVALNDGLECESVGSSIHYTNVACDESWTQATLGLGPLTEEAGTWVHPLLPGSPLIDRAGPPATCPHIDQRGYVRPSGMTCDVGAYEYEGGSAIAPLEFATPSGGVPGVIPLYTDTPEPSVPIILTFAKNAYCRKGPSALYRDTSGFKQGDTAQADGRNETDPRWWWVQIPNSTEHCWVSYITVIPNIPAEDLPIQPTAALELPAAPANFVISKRTCSQSGYSLQLAWTKSAGADGYTLYRNGQEIAAFKAGQTIYQEKPPLDQSLHYELEAFNENGFSERLVVEDRCP